MRYHGFSGRGGALALILALSGCLGGPFAGPVAEPRASGSHDAISVTPLPNPGTELQESAVAQGGSEDRSGETAVDQGAALAPTPDPDLPDTARRAPPRRPAAQTTGTIARPAAAPAPAGPPPLPVPSTVFGQQNQAQAQDQCRRAGGRLARRGSADALTCFIQPQDAGKRCARDSDCQGRCLARSGTCSPVIPLLGCHEVLLDSGMRVTECRE